MEAVNAVEDHAQKVMDAEIKRMIERPEVVLKESSGSGKPTTSQTNNPASKMIEAISQRVKGRQRMNKLIEKSENKIKPIGLSNLVSLNDRKD